MEGERENSKINSIERERRGGGRESDQERNREIRTKRERENSKTLERGAWDRKRERGELFKERKKREASKRWKERNEIERKKGRTGQKKKSRRDKEF